MYKKRGQVAAEFVLLIIVGFVTMVIFAAFARDQATDLKQDRIYSALQDIGYSSQREVIIASEAIDGYQRNFDLAALVEGAEYNITIENEFLLASTEGFEIVLRIPDVVGNFTSDQNTIRKEGGVIYLNQ